MISAASTPGVSCPAACTPLALFGGSDSACDKKGNIRTLSGNTRRGHEAVCTVNHWQLRQQHNSLKTRMTICLGRGMRSPALSAAALQLQTVNLAQCSSSPCASCAAPRRSSVCATMCLRPSSSSCSCSKCACVSCRTSEVIKSCSVTRQRRYGESDAFAAPLAETNPDFFQQQVPRGTAQV